MQQIIMDFGALELLGLRIPLRIYGYGLMLVFGFLSGIYLARRRARRMGENPDDVTHVGLLALVGGIVGSRAAYIIQHWDAQFADAPNKLTAVLNVTSGGLIYYGGLIAGTVLVLAFLWIKRLPVRRYLDIVAVSLMVGLAFGRAGCLLNGCCYGGACDPDWALGMRFPMFSTPLINVNDEAGPFSPNTESPSPIYAKQTHEGHVHPDPRLRFDASGNVLPPRALHGALDRDQFDVLLGDADVARKEFIAVAGEDEMMDRDEWRGALATGMFLRGSEVWDDAIGGYDEDRDGELCFDEAWKYLGHRREQLIQLFDADHSGTLVAAERDQANTYLQADLFALARASWSAPVQPAQPLGIINALLLAVLLTFFHRIRRREGHVFALMAILYPITRFVLEAIRDDNPHNLMQGVLTHNQYTSLALSAAGVILYVAFWKLPASAGPSLAERTAAAVAAKSGKTKR